MSPWSSRKAARPDEGRAAPAVPVGSRKRRSRGLLTVSIVGVAALFASLIAAGAGTNTAEAEATGFAHGPGVAEPLPSGFNKVAIPNFNPDTWKATPAMPLPVLESPITFHLSDQPSVFFDNGMHKLEKIYHTRSLGVGFATESKPLKVQFDVGEPFTGVQHLFTSLIWPEGAKNMPYTQDGAESGMHSVDLTTPGLYAFYCAIHPYMIGAVVVLNPTPPNGSVGLDLGKKLHWLGALSLPTDAEYVQDIVHAFFILEEPANLQHTARDHNTTWDPQFPDSPLTLWKADGTPHVIPNLNLYFRRKFHTPAVLKPPVPPTETGVGTIYYDSQWEAGEHKSKWGTITPIDASTWKVKAKWFGDSINLDHPHNYWADAAGKYVYSTNWFRNDLAVFDRQTGKVLKDITVGPSPSHVMTRTPTDHAIVAIDGGGEVVELGRDPVSGIPTKVIKLYKTQPRGDKAALPHGFWVDGNGRRVATPDQNLHVASIIDMTKTPAEGQLRQVPVGPDRNYGSTGGQGQVAISMTSDAKRMYLASLWSDDIECVSLEEPACPTPDGGIQETYDILMLDGYDPITGKVSNPVEKAGVCFAPVQIPISPDDSTLIGACTASDNAVVIDLHNDTIASTLPTGAGAHGANFGARKGGGYLAYETNNFVDYMSVIDTSDGATAARNVGNVSTDPEPDGSTYMDDSYPKAGDPAHDHGHDYIGEGGNGIEIYPNVYNGWIQNDVKEDPDRAEIAELTCQQKDPLSKTC